jgi:flagellar assembly factor FliW
MTEPLKAMSWDPTEKESILLYVVVNIPKGCPERMTANFIGPILVNLKKCQAVQTVIGNSPYSHNVPLMKDKEK